ncbi:microcompartments protein [[Leptolyngbya] sp. PCC 7376]|uniref:carbon dioxide-concentrating mechanism protein n=1 Tax=[Leptolyngbya] sp. PCC 7376 TaxID=111781 RepID=UPI00029F46C2|nr:microcompartments protein [[Leptolyngbya] sp. PCC 7376]
MNFPARRQSLQRFPKQAAKQEHPFRDFALGLVSTKSFPAIVGTADMMLKSADVTLVGYEKIGAGFCTAVVRGKTADVRLAVEEGARTAAQFDQYVSKLVIPRPLENLEAIFPIGSHLVEIAHEQRGYSRLSNRSIGLLETRGFPAMVGAADAMLKSADVQLASYETIGDGLCTAIIRGTVSNVAMAIDAGMHEAERIGELHAVMIIPRLLEDLEHTLPVADYWLDKAEPMPDLVKKEVPQRIALPELEPVSVPVVVDLEVEPEQEQEKAVEVEIVEPFNPGEGY